MTTVSRCLIFSPLLQQNHSPGCSSDSSRRPTNPLPDRPRLLLHIDVAGDADDDHSYLLVCCDHEVPRSHSAPCAAQSWPRTTSARCTCSTPVTGVRRPLLPVAMLLVVARVEGLQVHLRGGGGAPWTPWSRCSTGARRCWRTCCPSQPRTSSSPRAERDRALLVLLKSPAVSPSSSPMKSASLPPAPERDGERNFLVEFPRGELMQVELLRLVAVASGEGFVVRVLDECGKTLKETEDTRRCLVLQPSTVYFDVGLEGGDAGVGASQASISGSRSWRTGGAPDRRRVQAANVYSNFQTLEAKHNGIEGKAIFVHPRALWTFCSSFTLR